MVDELDNQIDNRIELDAEKWRDVFMEAIENAKRKHKWIERAEKAMQVYRCERKDGQTVYYPTLASTVQVQQGAIINNVPDIVVTGQNELTYADDKLAQIVEKTLNHFIDENDLGGEIDKFTESCFAASNGAIRVNDDLTFTAVNHENWIYEPCSDFAQCDWMAFKHYISKGVYVDKWGEPTASEYKEDNKAKGYCVWEVWDKLNKKIWWISDAHDEALDALDPDVKYTGFYPIAKPYIESCKTLSYEPVVAYDRWIHLDMQIQTIAQREDVLTESIKSGYFFEEECFGTLSQIEFTADQQGIPVTTPNKFKDTAGQFDVNKAISYWDNGPAINNLMVLNGQREQLLQKVYQIVGISNEMQSVSDVKETATAQKIKQGWGTSRLEGKRRTVHRIIRDTIRLYAEAIYQVVGIDEIQKIANEDNIEEHFIRQMNEGTLTKYTIDIETQTTLAINEKNERAEKLESLSSLSMMINQLGPLVDSGKMTMDVMVGFMKMVTESYPSSQNINDELDTLVENHNTVQQLQGQVQQQGQQLQEVNKAYMQMEQENLGLKQALQNTTMIDQQKTMAETAVKQADAQSKLVDTVLKKIEAMQLANSATVEPTASIDEQLAYEVQRQGLS